ncbi:MAG: YbjN domain-containing protein [Myxococcota bacterium]|jgi:hypothetical protein|nr:YbjN domain-containing protein [Myxococcota bacterium]
MSGNTDSIDTGRMGPRTLVDLFLERFSRTVSKAVGQDLRFGPLDEQGSAVVSRGSVQVTMSIFEDEPAALVFVCPVMPVPASGRESLYRRLLELNFVSTADAAFAVDARSEKVCLRAMRPIAHLQYEEFEELLDTVATVADEWDDRLRGEFG